MLKTVKASDLTYFQSYSLNFVALCLLSTGMMHVLLPGDVARLTNIELEFIRGHPYYLIPNLKDITRCYYSVLGS